VLSTYDLISFSICAKTGVAESRHTRDKNSNPDFMTQTIR
jgi:hypothetical protein